VVSLVPSLTESIAVTAPGLLVGATDWCTHPADLDVARVGGTKNPRADDVLDLRPDVVVANEEENRAADLDELRARGCAVWVTAPRTVSDAFTSLDAVLRSACRLSRPEWLDAAEDVWRGSYDGPRRRALVPIWRRPWKAIGRNTFSGDVLERLGVDNILADAEERYPRVSLNELPSYDVVVLPDEPYAFSADDGPECFPDVDVRCVSGRHLTWYGPSLVEARTRLMAELS
jgi:ABC-type Fe3+-hydroxamate transport system substrate-binding protein